MSSRHFAVNSTGQHFVVAVPSLSPLSLPSSSLHLYATPPSSSSLGLSFVPPVAPLQVLLHTPDTLLDASLPSFPAAFSPSPHFSSLLFHPTLGFLFLAATSSCVTLYDLSATQPIKAQIVRKSEADFGAQAFSPVQPFLLASLSSSSPSLRLSIYDLRALEQSSSSFDSPPSSSTSSSSGVPMVTFHPQLAHLLLAGHGHQVAIYDMRSSSSPLMHWQEPLSAPLTSLQFSSINQRQMLLCDSQRQVRFCKVETLTLAPSRSNSHRHSSFLAARTRAHSSSTLPRSQVRSASSVSRHENQKNDWDRRIHALPPSLIYTHQTREEITSACMSPVNAKLVTLSARNTKVRLWNIGVDLGEESGDTQITEIACLASVDVPVVQMEWATALYDMQGHMSVWILNSQGRFQVFPAMSQSSKYLSDSSPLLLQEPAEQSFCSTTLHPNCVDSCFVTLKDELQECRTEFDDLMLTPLQINNADGHISFTLAIGSQRTIVIPVIVLDVSVPRSYPLDASPSFKLNLSMQSVLRASTSNTQNQILYALSQCAYNLTHQNQPCLLSCMHFLTRMSKDVLQDGPGKDELGESPTASSSAKSERFALTSASSPALNSLAEDEPEDSLPRPFLVDDEKEENDADRLMNSHANQLDLTEVLSPIARQEMMRSASTASFQSHSSHSERSEGHREEKDDEDRTLENFETKIDRICPAWCGVTFGVNNRLVVWASPCMKNVAPMRTMRAWLDAPSSSCQSNSFRQDATTDRLSRNNHSEGDLKDIAHRSHSTFSSSELEVKEEDDPGIKEVLDLDAIALSYISHITLFRPSSPPLLASPLNPSASLTSLSDHPSSLSMASLVILMDLEPLSKWNNNLPPLFALSSWTCTDLCATLQRAFTQFQRSDLCYLWRLIALTLAEAQAESLVLPFEAELYPWEDAQMGGLLINHLEQDLWATGDIENVALIVAARHLMAFHDSQAENIPFSKHAHFINASPTRTSSSPSSFDMSLEHAGSSPLFPFLSSPLTMTSQSSSVPQPLTHNSSSATTSPPEHLHSLARVTQSYYPVQFLAQQSASLMPRPSSSPNVLKPKVLKKESFYREIPRIVSSNSSAHLHNSHLQSGKSSRSLESPSSLRAHLEHFESSVQLISSAQLMYSPSSPLLAAEPFVQIQALDQSEPLSHNVPIVFKVSLPYNEWSREDSYMSAYIENLLRQQQFVARAWISKCGSYALRSWLNEVWLGERHHESKKSQLQTGYVITRCGLCGQETGLGAPTCFECRRHCCICAVCMANVTGLATFCHECGHGGHMTCLSQWFAEESSGCATGCGCFCLVVSN